MIALLWAKKASTGIEVGVLCRCPCYCASTPNTCHAACHTQCFNSCHAVSAAERTHYFSQWTSQTVPSRRVVALAMELEVWQPPGSQTTLRKMFRIKIEALKKMRTPALEVTIQSFRKQVLVSECSYSNHQSVAALREVILASVLLSRGLALQWALSQPWLCECFDLATPEQ